MINEILFSTLKDVIFFSILNFLFERLLIKLGCIRGDYLSVLIATILTVSLLQFLSLGKIEDFSFITYFFAVVFGIPMSMNHSDLLGTMTKGRWWWKFEEK